MIANLLINIKEVYFTKSVKNIKPIMLFSENIIFLHY